MYKIERLNSDHLAVILYGEADRDESTKSYLSDGSVGYCLLRDGIPVFAGGVVSMGWNRGEAWLRPPRYLHKHVRVCYRYMRDLMPVMVVEGGFRRVQAVCAINISASLFEHLGFHHEGVLQAFGPKGETCHVYARIFR